MNHPDARRRLDVLFHLYFVVSERLLGDEEHPLEWVEDTYPAAYGDELVAAWYQHHDDRHDWLDTVRLLIEREL